VLALFLVREPPRPASTPPTVTPEAVAPGSAVERGPMPRPLLLFFAASLVFALGNSSDVFLLLRARDLGLSTTLTVLAYVVYNFVYMLAAYPIGILSDHVGRRGVFVVGLAAFALTYVGFAVVAGSTLLWPLFAVYGIYMAATDGVGKALITDFAPPERRASAIGLHGMITGLGALVASILAGQLWDHVSVAAPFMLGAASAGLAIVLLLGATRRKTQPAQP